MGVVGHLGAPHGHVRQAREPPAALPRAPGGVDEGPALLAQQRHQQLHAGGVVFRGFLEVFVTKRHGFWWFLGLSAWFRGAFRPFNAAERHGAHGADPGARPVRAR